MVSRPKQRGGRYRASSRIAQPISQTIDETLNRTIKSIALATNQTKRKQYSLGYRLAAPVWPLMHTILWKTLQLLLVTQAKRATRRKKIESKRATRRKKIEK